MKKKEHRNRRPGPFGRACSTAGMNFARLVDAKARITAPPSRIAVTQVGDVKDDIKFVCTATELVGAAATTIRSSQQFALWADVERSEHEDSVDSTLFVASDWLRDGCELRAI